jgi:carbamoyl-phosphate synthase/aspartate carbamoyltransferase
MNGNKTVLTAPHDADAVLELYDGTLYPGISFGAPGKSIAGECVFQTGK